jgi:hypothetical protein
MSTRNTSAYTALTSDKTYTRRELIGGAGFLAATLLGSAAVLDVAHAAESSQPGEPPTGDAGGQPSGAGGAGGANTMTYDYSGTYSGALTADGAEVTSDGETYDATEVDQNAALCQNAGTLTITNGTFTKSGDDTNGDNCNFYGCNSIVLAVNEGSTIKIDNSALSATSEGSNGIFSTDSATVYASAVSIDTTAGNSRGLDATYSGTIVADDVVINTQGDHCAGVATDRGGGNISVTNSEITTAGSGSPVLYSTGDIEVNNITGTATGSQLCGMEGLNTILINASTLESTITSATASDPVADGVIIYQSTSGDAESTTGESATFQAVNSELKSAITSGAMFYLTNTSANVVLSNTTLDFDSDACYLLYAAGNDANNWGSAGSNGATCNFTGIGQTMAGNIVTDTISQVNVYLLSGTEWTGAGVIETNSAGSTVDEPLNVYVDADSFWKVTADTTVSSLHVADGGQVVDADGNTVTIVAAGATAVTGTSAYTVTVNGTYDTTVETADANALATELIDRTGFDDAFGTSTAFAMGDSAEASASSSSATEAA